MPRLKIEKAARTRPGVSKPDQDKLIQENFPLVEQVARRLQETLPVAADSTSLAGAEVLGLIEAINKVDPQRHPGFSAFASVEP